MFNFQNLLQVWSSQMCFQESNENKQKSHKTYIIHRKMKAQMLTSTALCFAMTKSSPYTTKVEWRDKEGFEFL